MRRKPVSSSMIASVGYAAKKRVLEVEFLSGRIYQYLDVDRETHDALLKAPSLGTYFNAHIKDEYAFVRLA
jgi:KTSC domain-containing protein